MLLILCGSSRKSVFSREGQFWAQEAQSWLHCSLICFTAFLFFAFLPVAAAIGAYSIA